MRNDRPVDHQARWGGRPPTGSLVRQQQQQPCGHGPDLPHKWFDPPQSA